MTPGCATSPGLGPENIDHDGFPQMPLRSGPGWAEVGGLSAAAQIMEQLGGAYIDFQHRVAAGVDGVSVVHYAVTGHDVNIRLKSLLSGLTVPYDKPYSVELHVKGLPLTGQNYNLTLNDGPALALTEPALEKLPLTVYPDGRIMVSK